MTDIKAMEVNVTTKIPVLPRNRGNRDIVQSQSSVTKLNVTPGVVAPAAPPPPKLEKNRVKPELLKEMLRLERSYFNVLEERQIELYARNLSVRQTAWAAVTTMLALLTLGTAFVKHEFGVPISHAVLFSVYTVTSAGFGNVRIPFDESPALLTFAICYVYLGISALAILVAQSLQYFVTLFARVQHNTQKLSLVMDGYTVLSAMQQDPSNPNYGPRSFVRGQLVQELEKTKSHLRKDVGPTKKIISKVFVRCKSFAIRKHFVIPSFLLFLILLGTVVMMILEGWNFSEALYFSTFAMTTVGYGDFTPTKASSTWFVIFWLPFNVPFLALYLSSVARVYLNVHDWNVRRLENVIRKKIVDAGIPSQAPSVSMESDDDDDVEIQQLVKAISSSDEGSSDGSLTSLSKRHGRSDSLLHIVIRKEGQGRIRQLSHLSFGKSGERVEDNHVDNITTVRELLVYLGCTSTVGVDPTTVANANEFQSESHSHGSFTIKLHFQVLHRLATFITHEICRVTTSMQVNKDTVSITIPTLNAIAENCLIPYRARDAFRSIVLESLILIGEKDLLSHGLESFLDLHPIQFDTLFRPFAIALDDTDTMNAWLASTAILEDRLKNEHENLFPLHSSLLSHELKNPIEDFFPVNAGNAIRMQL